MSDRPRSPSAGDYLLGEARYAVQDIRQKLVEEAWCGRVMTAAPVIEIDKARDVEISDRSALEEAWGKARHQPKPEHEPEHHAPELDR